MTYRKLVAAILTCGVILATGAAQVHAKSDAQAKPKKHAAAKDKESSHRSNAPRPRSEESRLQAIQRQSEQLEKIHALRLAKLQRIRQLAQEKPNDRLVSKVDQLIERENGKYARRKARLEARRARTIGKQHPTTRPHDESDDEAQLDRVQHPHRGEAKGQQRRGRKEVSNQRGKGRDKIKSTDRDEDRDQSIEDEK